MKFIATVHEVDGRVLADCADYGVQGEGATEAEAIRSLRLALFERVLRPQAVAPPSHPEGDTIEIVVVPLAISTVEHGPNGPGEAP